MDLDPEIYEWDVEHWWLKEYSGNGRYRSSWYAICTISDWHNNEPWSRRPKTTQERKANQLSREEDRFFRLRRSPHLLVEHWDDILIHKDKCWKSKSKRRHQWKNIKQM
jgi:hypothetical protein